MTPSRDRDAVQRLVKELNSVHGLELRVLSRFASGMQGGAWILEDTTGRPAVLKHRPAGPWPDIRRVAAAVARVRAAGYATPAWLASGTTTAGVSYWVQDYVAGRPATPLTTSTTELLIEVLEQQAGLGPASGRDWRRRVMAMALSNEPGWPRRAVRGLGAAGRMLLDSFDRLLAHAGGVRLPGQDMVHGDFNSCNILLHPNGAGVAGVIDVQDLGSGSRVVDYACLLREAYVESYGDEVVRLIRRRAEAVAGWAALVSCAAAAAYFIVEFKLRHQPEVLATVLSRLHRLAEDLADP